MKISGKLTELEAITQSKVILTQKENTACFLLKAFKLQICVLYLEHPVPGNLIRTRGRRRPSKEMEQTAVS